MLAEKDKFGRPYPALSIRNSIDRLFNTVEAPTDNVAWMDSISHRLAIVTAEMNAEREREQRMEMEQFTQDFGLGMGA
jgi:hypothetical protein